MYLYGNKSQTYTDFVAFAPAMTGLVFMRRIKLYLQSASLTWLADACTPALPNLLCHFRSNIARYTVTASLHRCTIASLHHCIISSLHRCSITSLQHCIIVSLHYCNVASLHHCIVVSLHRCIIASLHHCIIASLHPCIIA